METFDEVVRAGVTSTATLYICLIIWKVPTLHLWPDDGKAANFQRIILWMDCGSFRLVWKTF